MNTEKENTTNLDLTTDHTLRALSAVVICAYAHAMTTDWEDPELEKEVFDLIEDMCDVINYMYREPDFDLRDFCSEAFLRQSETSYYIPDFGELED